jgi:hypothetical protein
MRRHRAAAVATAVLLALGVAGCGSGDGPKTQDEIAAQCVPALKARAEGDGSKPKACEGLTEENYDTLVIAIALEDVGLIDENGEVNLDALLED